MSTNKKSHGIELLDTATIKNLNLEQLSADPTSLIEGRMWYNTTDKIPKVAVKDTNNNIIPQTMSGGAGDLSNDTETVYIKDPVKAVLTSVQFDNFTQINERQDGLTLNVNDRVLYTNAIDAKYNGIYKITSKGAPIPQAAYLGKIPSTGLDKDDIIIESLDTTGTSMYLNITSHANGTPATLVESQDDVFTLDLERSTQVNTSASITSYTGRIANSGGVIQFTLKATSPYKHAQISFFDSTYLGNYYSAITPSTDSTNVVISGVLYVLIGIKYLNTYSNTSLVASINADTVINSHISATVISGGTYYFDPFTDNMGNNTIPCVLIMRKETYNTKASDILTLINSTTKLRAKVNSSTTLSPRWTSVFGSTNWDVRQGTFDNIKYTSTTNKLVLAFAYTNVYSSGPTAYTRKWFNPTKIKVTFTGTCSSIGLAYDYNIDVDKYNQEKFFQTISSPASGTSVNITYPNGYVSNFYGKVQLVFTSPSNDLQVTNIEYYMGDDYYIFSDIMFSHITEPTWVSIFGPSNFRVYDFTDSWNGTKFISTQNNNIRVLFNLDSVIDLGRSRKPYSLDIHPIGTKARIYYTTTGNVTLTIYYANTYYDQYENVISNYVSGTEIDFTSIPELNNNLNYTRISGYSLESAAVPITIDNIQYYYDQIEYFTGSEYLRCYIPGGRCSNLEITYVTATRTDDAKSTEVNADLFSGVLIYCKEGTLYNQTMWQIINPGDITIGTTGILFNNVLPVLPGYGLTKSNGKYIVVAANDSITVTSSGIKIKDNSIRDKINTYNPGFIYTSTTPATTHTIIHNYNVFELMVTVWVWHSGTSKWNISTPTNTTSIVQTTASVLTVVVPTSANIKVVIMRIDYIETGN